MRGNKKIGCLDETALNYDKSVGIACDRCCITSEQDSRIKNVLDFMLYGKRDQNKPIDYSIYAVSKLDGNPIFNIPSQAKEYGLQIGCVGFHEHIIKGKKLYMACSSHEEAIGEDKIEPTGEDYIENITTGGVVQWYRSTTMEKQVKFCEEKVSEGYKWDRIDRICAIPSSDNNDVGNHQIIGYVDNIPVWYTKGAALQYANVIKCDGYFTYGMDNTTGYVACENYDIISKKILGVECKGTRKMMDGTLSFIQLGQKNASKYGEACCLEHAHLGYLWNGRGCVKNQMELTWSCINNLTTEIYDGTGDYKTFKECLIFCEKNKR
tara:strand:+ start:17472 stop:18440 length:969 start_codon:yes stop_codon:yes gene_type:complete